LFRKGPKALFKMRGEAGMKGGKERLSRSQGERAKGIWPAGRETRYQGKKLKE